MNPIRTLSLTVVIVAGLAGAQRAVAQQTFMILFENSGDEQGITVPGATTFSIFGSNWSGGVVDTEFVPPLYASGSFSYEVVGGSAEVTFDEPIDNVEFFFVHGFGFSPGTATAFDADDNELDSVSSNQATSFNDPANFETIDSQSSIARIAFTGGVIDDFSFTVAEVKECPQDLDDSGAVDVFDLLDLLGAWGTCPGCPQDITGDDVVDVFDLLDLLSAWGPC